MDYQSARKSHPPVNLVGHDWGCMFALRIASLRPDLVHTVAGGNGPISKDYEWHPLAKTWQTPQAGERFMRELSTDALTGILRTSGVNKETAKNSAERVDDRMKNCVLKLYRSAVHVGEEWQPGLRGIRSPALSFWGKNDRECPVRFAHQMAENVPGARAVELDSGHWVPLEKPRELAALLKEHWRTVA